MRGTVLNRAVVGTALGALTAALATGCSFEASLGGVESVLADEIADQAAAALEEEVGQALDDLTCDESLPAEVGASIRCELTAGGQVYGVTVTTTSVDGADVNFDVQVDEEPMG
ncbi:MULTISPECIES: DUF4333 domain-containing protein [unclassified Nocardiopsis]|uniref:DUF4333 domain-containing protein n=1 Tax=unclassified Nocardiopsis TaxID=2649073 RepID=UPI00135996E7|nr:MULTISPECIES: DUF4333 domain-containing protein [unclassified Nocardiopsis]